MLKLRIENDLKKAMLSGDKTLTTVLRGLKSSILYAEVAQNKREAGLSDSEIESLLMNEAKKRQESADLYKKGQRLDKYDQEISEKKVIEQYLPKQIDEDEINTIIDSIVGKEGIITASDMGSVIAQVKQKTGSSASGSTIASLVKQRIAKVQK